ncbi:hypothetical protein AB0K00_33375 [Dactylosporangium sp. NPDC049525]|uniref:hypothetical protein n=1 Tax=Dactylosporangium sp. NPDC049525 TaxID=3154730 RepID=UPI0034462270
MRNRLAGLMAVLVLAAAAACARDAAAQDPAPAAPASGPPASAGATRDAEVYVQVLRRYLGTPAENSFPERTFRQIFVLDRVVPDSGRPEAPPANAGEPLPGGIQQHIVGALSDVGPVSFVADRKSVIVPRDGCDVVKDDGILITLDAVDGEGDRVEVGINGFVACLGATWLTYVVERTAGGGWQVTGTTGPMAIA